MNQTSNKHTEPFISKGKKPTNIPRGSNLDTEWAKNVWYINYSFNGKQQRIKGNINRIKDPKSKDKAAKALLLSIVNDLEKGYDPENKLAFSLRYEQDSKSLSEAIDEYLSELGLSTRPNTVKSYKSKLRYLLEAFPAKLVKEIQTNDLERYITSKIKSMEPAKIFIAGRSIKLKKAIQWTPNTVRTARGVFVTFFTWCKEKGYITENPATEIQHKKTRSDVRPPDRHIPYSQDDVATLMNYLDSHDPFTALFVRIINSTCIRPKEISELQLKDIDLTHKTITIPLATMKNTKKLEPDVVSIEKNLLAHLEKLNLHQYPKDYYLMSNYQTIVGEKPIGNNRPYKRFVKALAKVNLQGKGYTLYSFKHFSNIQRFKNNWELPEIMKANRHSDISMTLKYMKQITRETDISTKEVPGI